MNIFPEYLTSPSTLFSGRPRSLLLITLTILIPVSGCITVKRGYIFRTRELEEQITSGRITKDSVMPLLLKSKIVMHAKSDSIGSLFPRDYHSRLNASQINGLFENLQENLKADSILQAFVRTDGDCSALKCLMASADVYDKNFFGNTRSRRLVNRGNRSFGIAPSFLNRTHRYLLSPVVRNNKTCEVKEPLSQHPSCAALTGFAVYRRFDRLNEFGYDAINGVSRLFGNIIGHFSAIKDRSREQKMIEKIVQPLDIILLKSSGHLTDKFIPGYFGHAAIWMGDKADLQREGWWSLPEVIPFRRMVRAGKTFAEGLRSGVTLSDLEEFTDGEVFLVIRPVGFSPEEKREIVRLTFSQINKEYDFNYDIESPDRIFCSELVFDSFEKIDWKTHVTWGRVSMTPDEVAETALESSRLTVAALITGDGITEKPSAEKIRNLLKE